jgi:NADPH:quinone reductase-like Zn-dependent oxidoreductase
METMKAMICTKYGPPEVLQIQQCTKPIPRQDEVLIKIYATSVTNSDLFIRGSDIPLMFIIPMRLMLGITKPRNPIIGEVFAGEIESVGSEITRFHVGDQVYCSEIEKSHGAVAHGHDFGYAHRTTMLMEDDHAREAVYPHPQPAGRPGAAG